MALSEAALWWLAGAPAPRGLERVCLFLRGLWTYRPPDAHQAETIPRRLTPIRTRMPVDETAEYEYLLTLCHLIGPLPVGGLRDAVVTALRAPAERGFAEGSYRQGAREAIARVLGPPEA